VSLGAHVAAEGWLFQRRDSDAERLGPSLAARLAITIGKRF